MKSSIPLTTYRLEPSTLANVTGDAIRRFAFRSIDNAPNEKGYGFVPEDDMFADLETSVLEKGQCSFPNPERRNSKTFASPGSFQKQNPAPL